MKWAFVLNSSPRDINQILALNTELQNYGIQLQRKDVLQLINEEKHQLEKTHRIAINQALIPLVLSTFKKSVYLNKLEIANSISELLEAFYALKTVAARNISDVDLLDAMLHVYDLHAHGDVKTMVDVLEEAIQESLEMQISIQAFLEYKNEAYLFLEERYELKDFE